MPKNLTAGILASLGTIYNDEQEAENTLLADLSLCESGNRDDIKILDVNGKYSYGILQFQLESFYTFGQRYKILPADLELLEAENFIYDKDYQTKISREMLRDGLWWHWRNCLKNYEQKNNL